MGFWLFVAVAAAVLVIDQVTKSLAVSRLADGPAVVVDDLLIFRLRYNSGAAFSTFETGGVVIGILALAAVVFLALQARKPQPRGLLVGFGLIAGGALGNLVDRLFRGDGMFRGRVVDFVDMPSLLPFGGERWPTFNVADASLIAGVIVVVVWVVFDIGRGAGTSETT